MAIGVFRWLLGKYLAITEQFRVQGSGIAWDDWQFDSSGLRLPGVNDPRYAKYRDDGAGSTGVYGWHFSGGEVASFDTKQIRHSYVEGTALKPHVHFLLVNPPVVGQTVTWVAEVLVVGLGGSAGLTSLHTGSYIFTIADAQWDEVTLDLTPDYPGAGLTISSQGTATITRGGTYGATEVLFQSFDLHHQNDGFGSDQPASKIP